MYWHMLGFVSSKTFTQTSGRSGDFVTIDLQRWGIVFLSMIIVCSDPHRTFYMPFSRECLLWNSNVYSVLVSRCHKSIRRPLWNQACEPRWLSLVGFPESPLSPLFLRAIWSMWTGTIRRPASSKFHEASVYSRLCTLAGCLGAQSLAPHQLQSHRFSSFPASQHCP